MGSESEKQDKLAKLQARKKDLEQLLSVKNEELYKLCVQEVQLTGVMPPEAPLSPEAPSQRRERLESVRSVGDKSLLEGNDVRDSSESLNSRHRHPHADSEQQSRKNVQNRLSTPSISGLSTKSAPQRHTRRPETSCSNYFPSPPHDGLTETFSMHTSQTYPSIADNLNRLRSPNASREVPNVVFRHHTMSNNVVNKSGYSNSYSPDAQSHSRLRETHFTSSHPDISNQNAQKSPPLLFQYASQLRAQSPHLNAINSAPRRRTDGRRATLQRTQTYHLTAHSDYPTHIANLQNITVEPRGTPANPRRQVTSVHLQLNIDTKSTPLYQNLNAISPTSLDNVSRHSGDGSDGKPKEKHWYESSLDSPTSSNLPSPSKGVKRSSSISNSQSYESMAPPIPPHSKPTVPLLSPTISNADVTIESPKNCTIIEHGKWKPYREETKPFEMSDFYKYSTKFRQANQKQNSFHQVGAPLINVNNNNEQFVGQEHWHHH